MGPDSLASVTGEDADRIQLKKKKKKPQVLVLDRCKFQLGVILNENLPHLEEEEIRGLSYSSQLQIIDTTEKQRIISKAFKISQTIINICVFSPTVSTGTISTVSDNPIKFFSK